MLSCQIVAKISFTFPRRTSTSRHKDYTMSQTVLVGACLLTHWYLLHPPRDQEWHLVNTQQSSSSIDSRLLTVAVNDVDRTVRSMVAMPVSEVGSRPRLPRPTRWNASSCIIETDGRDCDHNFARLRIDHLEYLEYCSFFTRFASVPSYDAFHQTP